MDVIHYQKASRNSQGLTLIELIVVIAVLGILSGIAAPSFSQLILDQRQITQLNTLVGHLHLARSEAIKRRHWVVICKSHNGEQCTTGGDWRSGWIVFEDRNQDRQRNNHETLLAQQKSSNLEIRYGGFPSSNYVIYYPAGITKGNGTFTFCDRRGADQARALILAKPGRLRSSNKAANGSALNCSG